MVKVANSFVSTENCVVCTVEVHHIAENFHELVKNTIFAEKLSQIACFYRANGCHAPKFRRENFHK